MGKTISMNLLLGIEKKVDLCLCSKVYISAFLVYSTEYISCPYFKSIFMAAVTGWSFVCTTEVLIVPSKNILQRVTEYGC